MNKKIIVSSVSAALLTLPTLTFAYVSPPLPNPFTGNIDTLIGILLNILWPVAVAFFIVMFVIAGFLFATAQGEAEKLASARSAVIYGVVGIVVALVAFSMVQVIRTQLPGV